MISRMGSERADTIGPLTSKKANIHNDIDFLAGWPARGSRRDGVCGCGEIKLGAVHR